MDEARIVDSATQLDQSARGAVCVCGSHGGVYPAWLAAKAGVRAFAQVVAEEKKAVPAAQPVERPRPPPLLESSRELSLDEILQKVQRDIAESRPAASRQAL